MAAIPNDQRERVRQPHNLDQIAFRPPAAEAPATLAYLMQGYIEHLKHHLRQIAALAKHTQAV